MEVAKATREAPSRIPFLLKDPRGHADFYAALARHDAKGSANTMRSFQGGRPSIYTMTEAIRKVPTPALIICGDEDDNCIEPSLFLKKHLPAAGLAFFPKSGHVLNLEEPALFNEMVERFIALVEAGRWPVRDPRSMVAAPFSRHCERSEAIHFTVREYGSCLRRIAPGMTEIISPPRPGSAGTRPARRTCSRTTRACSAATGRP